MTECNWPTGAQSAGYFDGQSGKVSTLGKRFLSGDGGERGKQIYLYEYWCSFLYRKNATDTTFIYYPNEREGTK